MFLNVLLDSLFDTGDHAFRRLSHHRPFDFQTMAASTPGAPSLPYLLGTNLADAALGAVLREIGAHEADEWIIVADGAEWIWNRVPSLIKALDYDSSKVTEIVDFYHTVQHLGQVAAEVKRWSDGQRKVWVKEMKRHLLDGKFQVVQEAIEELCRGCKAKKIRKLLPYLTDNVDRLQYCDFRKKKIPIGSGAVESCVRRIINLRLKGNGIFWTLETAEGVLHLRAQMLSGRWDSFIKTVLQPHFLWSIEREQTAA